MAKTVKLEDLSPEQLAALKQQALDEERQKQEQVRQQRKDYKNLVNEIIPACFRHLVETSENLARAKKLVYDELETLVKLKGEVYDREDGQYSHSFTTDSGLTLIIGHRVNDGWDDTVHMGIQKVHDYLETLGTDKKSKDLVKAILQLLSKDSKGTLKASRVLQLKKIADDIGDEAFKDAISIIQDAYRPIKTKEFVTARYTTAKGEKTDLALDISAVDMDFKYDTGKTEEA